MGPHFQHIHCPTSRRTSRHDRRSQVARRGANEAGLEPHFTFPEMTCFLMVKDAIASHGLDVFGIVDQPEDGLACLVLLGPAPGFWNMFKTSLEWQDGERDAMDRWSQRVISDLADNLEAVPRFPFGGPPYAPFLQWAVLSGRAWSSPVGMLVHDTAGLMVSFRGALGFAEDLDIEVPASVRPCETCVDQPCLSACPVRALGARISYDVPTCKTHLSSGEGADCLSSGCLVRRSCPVSQKYGRDPDQSGYHMSVFLDG